ncbi:MAG: tetratricopeptide repeat protein [Proteobacteria bacterium]|nr:tetratricopeptide repeat protein [Pseudomonadota bacterium]
MALFIDDDVIRSSGGAMPGGEGVAEAVISQKHDVLNVISDRSSSLVYWFRTTINDVINFSPTDRTPKVVMKLPPPPKIVPVMTTEMPNPGPAPMPTSEPAPAAMPAAEPTAAPKPELAPLPIPSSEPAPEPPAPDKAMPAAPGMPAPNTSDAPPPPPLDTPRPAKGGKKPKAEAPAKTASQEVVALPPGTETDKKMEPAPPSAGKNGGDGDADHKMGLRFYNGINVEKNYGKAAEFFLKAAAVGHPGAQYNLGIMNFLGQTGGQDFTNAAKWFEKAAAQGHTQAQYNLGFLFYEGKGVERDLKKAFDWISRAAEQGDPKAAKARDTLRQALPKEMLGG